MEIKLLPKSLRETLRSEINVRSLAKCIAQLVYNSIDAKSRSIAIRMNLVSFKIQVIDNGTGISKNNLKLVGFRHATSKYYSVEDLEKNPYIFPSRGESLASIIKLSKTVKITTRCADSSKTFCKSFENGKSLPIATVKSRPSRGTTIIIDNFMYNLPVRKKSINQNSCLAEIKTEIENIALIHPNTSFSLRNDSTGEIIFHSFRSKYVFQTAAILYGKEFARRLRKLCYNDNNFSVGGLISMDPHPQNIIQFVYINSRLVSKTKLHTLINTLISKSKIIKNKISDSPIAKQKHSAFIINVKCPYSELDIVDYIELQIEFKNWDTVLTIVEKAVKQFLKKHDLIETKEPKKSYLQGSPLIEAGPNVRTSQVAGVIKGIPMKRKLLETETIEQSISPSTNEGIIKQIVSVDVHSFPKKMRAEMSPNLRCEKSQPLRPMSPNLRREKSQTLRPMPPNLRTEKSRKETPQNDETSNEQHNISLESKSEDGKAIIMDVFLKSTKVFPTDDQLKDEELLSFKSAEKYTNRTNSSCIVSTLKNSYKSVTSAKISVTKTIEHNINLNNYNDNIFKVPNVPKLLKRKSSRNSSSTEKSTFLVKNKNVVNKTQKQINENTVLQNFESDFLKNISKRNNLPPDITNHFSNILNHFAKQPKRKNYECTIKITKRHEYLQSTDFLKPATKIQKTNYPVNQIKYKNSFKDKPKEIVHSNSMLKTYFDIKNSSQKTHQFHNNYQMIKSNSKIPHFIPKTNCNYVSNLRDKNNLFKNELSRNFLPIYNIKHSQNRRSNNYNNDKSYYIPNDTRISKTNFHENRINFPSSDLPFKLFSTNRNSSNYEPEKSYYIPNDKQIERSNFHNNRINFPSPELSFKPFSTNPNLGKLYCKNSFSFPKSNLFFDYEYPSPQKLYENKSDSKNEINTNPTFESHPLAKSYQNIKSNYLSDIQAMLKNSKNYFEFNKTQNELNVFNSKQNNNNTKSESIHESSNLTFIPETPEINTENLLQDCTENNNNLYYDKRNISKWVENSRNFVKNINISEEELNSPLIEIQRNTPSSNNIDKCVTINHESASNINFVTNPKEMENADETKNSSPIISIIPTPKMNINNNENSLIMKNYSNIDNNSNISMVIANFINNSKENQNVDINKNIPIFSFNASPKISIISTPKIHQNRNSERIEHKQNSSNNNKDLAVSIANCLNNSKDINNVIDTSVLSFNYSPIISRRSARKINISKENNTSEIKCQQNVVNKEQFDKDSINNFSSNSTLIQEKDITNILNALDESILNDSLKITISEKRNCVENKTPNLSSDLRSLESVIVSNNPPTNSFPVFQEDSSNLISENNKNIDKILNDQTNLTIIAQENHSGIQKTSKNLHLNILSKNTKESNENINQNETGNDEYGNQNQMPEWMKQTSELGNSFYLNLRTGMTSFGTPKNVDGCLVTRRHSFMPKGMSPILHNTSTAVSKPLSPNSKNILHQTIANTENDELQTVKWMNLLENRDSNKFFTDLYTADKNYEKEILNLNKYTLPKKIIAGFENFSFSKDDFNNITVIKQCDNKFIVTKIEIQRKYSLLVLFDQHAVHERIRLEQLLKDYEEDENKLKSVKCRKQIKLTPDAFEIKMMQNYKTNFENWGLFYEIQDNQNVVVKQIPLCWQARDDSTLKHKEYSIIESLIMTLIQEESSWLKNMRQINIALPIVIQNTIKTEACRTAVKFGDPLSKEQCDNLIKELFTCDLPFNCAHGRPTLIPIVDLNNLIIEDKEEQIDLDVLKI